MKKILLLMLTAPFILNAAAHKPVKSVSLNKSYFSIEELKHAELCYKLMGLKEEVRKEEVRKEEVRKEKLNFEKDTSSFKSAITLEEFIDNMDLASMLPDPFLPLLLINASSEKIFFNSYFNGNSRHSNTEMNSKSITAAGTNEGVMELALHNRPHEKIIIKCNNGALKSFRKSCYLLAIIFKEDEIHACIVKRKKSKALTFSVPTQHTHSFTKKVEGNKTTLTITIKS